MVGTWLKFTMRSSGIAKILALAEAMSTYRFP